MRLPSSYRYFDHAAGWPVRDEALTAYVAAARATGNPGSVHRAGQRAHALLEEGRQKLAAGFGCERDEVVLCSTSTEANNLAVRGTVAAFRATHPGVMPVIAISALEHEAVRVPAERVAAEGLAELVVIPVTRETGFDFKALEGALTERAALVSVMHVSNETGALLPIARISRDVRSFREDSAWPRFHSDAAQALAYVPDLATAHADLVTYSGYKVGGTPGAAALVVRGDRTRLRPLAYGGAQEFGLRSGTEDVPAVVAFAAAAELARGEVAHEERRMKVFKNSLLRAIAEAGAPIEENAGALPQADHIVSIWLRDARAQETLARLDLAGFAVAAGPACSARSLEPSRALLALGFGTRRAEESVRVSFGPDNDDEDVLALARELARVY